MQLRDEDWDQVIADQSDRDVPPGARRRARHDAPPLRPRHRHHLGGRRTGNPGQANYVAAKAGMTGMIKAIAQEYAKRGVTANCVAPGFIVTPMTDKLNDKQRETIMAKIPASRAGTLEEVAAAVVFLASNEAAYVTGQTLHVNGGMAMI